MCIRDRSSLLKEMQLVAEDPLPEAAPPLYVLTNTYRTNGATVLLYDDILKELSVHLPTAFGGYCHEEVTELSLIHISHSSLN